MNTSLNRHFSIAFSTITITVLLEASLQRSIAGEITLTICEEEDEGKEVWRARVEWEED